SRAARALISAFSSKVVPVSGGSSTASGNARSPEPGRISPSSRTLWSFRLARINFLLADRGHLELAQLVDPGLGQGQHLVERGPGERSALGGRLNLDQTALAGHHHVRIDLSGRILGVV